MSKPCRGRTRGRWVLIARPLLHRRRTHPACHLMRASWAPPPSPRAVPLRAGLRQAQFEAVVDEIVYLPTITNATVARQSVLDYLLLSREALIVVNRNTEAGYLAFERWATPPHSAPPPSGYSLVDGQAHLRLVDILHLSEHGDRDRADGAVGAQDGWEARSAPLHGRMHRRFLASEHLRQVLQRRWHLGVARDDDRFRILAPPVDPARFSEGAVRAAAVAAATAHATREATVMFLGRLDPQKDPLLWLTAACLVQRALPATRFRMIGDGPLQSAVEYALWIAEERAAGRDGAAVPAFPLPGDGGGGAEAGASLPLHVRNMVIHGGCDASAFTLERGVPHDMSAQRISEASVLMLSSAYEGTPIVILEALCLGVPVVATGVGAVPSLLAVRD